MGPSTFFKKQFNFIEKIKESKEENKALIKFDPCRASLLEANWRVVEITSNYYHISTEHVATP